MGKKRFENHCPRQKHFSMLQLLVVSTPQFDLRNHLIAQYMLLNRHINSTVLAVGGYPVKSYYFHLIFILWLSI